MKMWVYSISFAALGEVGFRTAFASAAQKNGTKKRFFADQSVGGCGLLV
jgi:hypothetical protein